MRSDLPLNPGLLESEFGLDGTQRDEVKKERKSI